MQSPSHSTDPHRLHRQALLPLGNERAAQAAAEALEPEALRDFGAFVERQGLAQLWRAALEDREPWPAGAEWLAQLRDHARLTAAHQMLQGRVLGELADLLGSHSVPWFLFKGADLRRWLYPDPVLRPVSDLDVFVRPADRQRALALLREHGYPVRFDPATASHEVSVGAPSAAIDLHWHLLRPGRARPGLEQWLFGRVEEHAGLPGLDATASLLVMLAHPAITKYLVSPTSMLIHQVDQARLLECGRVDWAALESALDRHGLKTAAWSSLYLLHELAGIAAPNEFAARIAPGPVHRAYLRQWIDRAWITRAFARRWLVAGLFSLALQDSVGDAWRAWRTRAQLRIPS